MTTNDQAATTLDTIIAIQSALATEPPISADRRARLAQVIAAAAIQREIDQRPCTTCGGDPLRPAFDGRTDCHAPWPKED